jgi:hypothetical protein
MMGCLEGHPLRATNAASVERQDTCDTGKASPVGARSWDDLPVFEEPRDALFLVQRWYVAQCNDEWEHSYGVTIDTLDNPGWSLRVDLAETAYTGTILEWSERNRSEHDWVHWGVRDNRFEAACGPTNLNEA